MADEIANFVQKFENLKNVGTRAFLWMESQAGVALVTLQVHLPGVQEDHRHRHHHHYRGDPRHRREHPRTKRATPSRVRRRDRREHARAEAVDILPIYPPQPEEEAEQAPPPPPHLDAQPKEQAVQAPHPPPQLDAQPNGQAVQAHHLPPQPAAVQAPPQLDAQPNEQAEQAVQAHHPPPQRNKGAEQAPSPRLQPAVDATASPPLGKAAPPLYPSLRHVSEASQFVLDPPLVHQGFAQGGGLPMAHPWPRVEGLVQAADDHQTIAPKHGSLHQQVHETWVRESAVRSNKRGGRNSGKKRRSRGQGGSTGSSAQTAEEQEYRADFEAWQMKTYGMICQ